jgi:hypothetical protein
MMCQIDGVGKLWGACGFLHLHELKYVPLIKQQ